MSRILQAGDALPEHRVTITARHIVLGAMASRDWQPQHHDHDHAIAANLPGIILNTPSQIGWFTGYLSNWAGPEARIARWRLKMSAPICSSTGIVFTGAVSHVADDPAGFRWAEFDLEAKVGPDVRSSARILAAMPGTINPWTLKGENWQPPVFSESKRQGK